MGQTLARSLLEPDLGLLELKLAVWTLGNLNFAQNRLEPKGGTLTQKQAPDESSVKKAFFGPNRPGGSRQSRDPGVKGNIL